MAIVGWLAIFLSTGYFVLGGVRIYLSLAALGIMIAGTAVFLVRARLASEWPFQGAAR